MLTCIYTAMKAGTTVFENEEAIMIHLNKRFFDTHTGQEAKAGEYLAIEKTGKVDVFGADTYRSTKGSFKRCKTAFEKYSPKWMTKIQSWKDGSWKSN